MMRKIDRRTITTMLLVIIIAAVAFVAGRATAPSMKTPWRSNGVVYFKKNAGSWGSYPSTIVIYKDSILIPAQKITGRKTKIQLIKIALSDTQSYKIQTIPSQAETTTISSIKTSITTPSLCAVKTNGKWIIYMHEGEQIPVAASISFISFGIPPETRSYEVVK